MVRRSCFLPHCGLSDAIRCETSFFIFIESMLPELLRGNGFALEIRDRRLFT